MGGSFVVGSHHFAKELARRGHAVTHLSAPVSFAHIALAVRRGFARTRLMRWARGGEEFDGVHDVVPFTLVPWRFARQFPPLMKCCSTLSIVPPFRGFSWSTVRSADWLIVDDPRLVGIATKKTRGGLVYRATDLYAEMGDDPATVTAEKILCAHADILIATSGVVARHLERISGRIVHVIENGVDYELFSDHSASSHALDIQLPGVRETRAVYVGSFDDRFGSDALSAAALRLPEINFILIGPGSDRAAMNMKMSNITPLGPIAYSKLPAILAQCSVGLLPLSTHAANAGRSPMKLYEYAAAGLTVAATATPELSRRVLSTLSLSENDLGYEAAVRRAFRQAADTALVELGRQEAGRESWASKTTHLLDLLQDGRPRGLAVHEQSHAYVADPRSLEEQG